MTYKKLNCRDGNVQCGGKCQSKTKKCPSEKSYDVSVIIDKYTKSIKAATVPKPTSQPAPPPKDLNALFGDYEKLISSESKKQSRAKIRGLPNERELKKELLKAEEKAWVFVRLMREKKRLSKKGEEVGELEALLQKIADGDKDSINKALADLDSKIAEKRKAKVETTVSKPVEKAVETIAKTVEKAAVVGESGSQKNPIDISTWKKVGAQLGSNPGGIYADENGNKFYIKESRSQSHAENERLASLLYERAGVDSVKVLLGKSSTDPSKVYTISPLKKKSVTKDLEDALNGTDIALKTKIQEGLAIDAWLANWDVIGDGEDNIIVDSDLKPVRVDPGGSLMWRARGEAKGKAFGNEATEIDSLRNSKTNLASAKIFGDMTEQQIVDSINKLETISNDDLNKVIDDEISNPAERALLKERLVERKKNLLKRAAKSELLQPTATEQKPVVSEETEKKLGVVARKFAEKNIPLLDEDGGLEQIPAYLDKLKAVVADNGAVGDFDLHGPRQFIKYLLLERGSDKDIKKISDPEKVRKILRLANKAILAESNNFGSLTREQKDEVKREFLYERYGDATAKMPIVGNKKLRGQASIPPLPAKFNEARYDIEPVDESFRNFLEEAKVIVQVTPKALEGILKAGKMKNMFHKGAADSIGEGASGYKKARDRREREIFNFSEEGNVPADERPIYGYIESPHYLNSASKTSGTKYYGEISVVLKEDAKKRSTITLEDSLSSRTPKPTPMLDPKKECYFSSTKSITIEAGSRSDLKDSEGTWENRLETYVEAQIFGGISLDDIDFLILPMTFADEYKEILKLLESKGISYRLIA